MHTLYRTPSMTPDTGGYENPSGSLVAGQLRRQIEAARAEASAHTIVARRSTGLAKTLEVSGHDAAPAWAAAGEANRLVRAATERADRLADRLFFVTDGSL